MCFVSSLLLVVMIVTCHACDETPQLCTGTYLGFKYCAYYPGDTGSKIVINAPHGGCLKPYQIPDRDAGCLSGSSCEYSHSCGTKDPVNCDARTNADDFTFDLAFLLRKDLETDTGSCPHLIVNFLHRSKLDGNREENEATFAEPEAITAYNEYHSFISTAVKSISGNGLFVDIHGHTHSHGLTELGYRVTKSRLNANTVVPNYSSMRDLNNRLTGTTVFDDVLRGDKSLGHFLEEQGYGALPSPTHYSPALAGTNAYYSGADNLKKYGSPPGDNIDGIQVEIHKSNRNAAKGPAFITGLAKAVKAFMDENGY